MDEEKVVAALGALAQPLRLRVFRALVVAGQGGMTPGALCESLGTPNATLSFHLKELARAGLVTQERASRHLVYRAVYESIDGVIAFLTENCCEGVACAVDAAPCNC